MNFSNLGDRPVGMETKSLGTGNINVDEAEGIVECFASGIGNKDSVGDIVRPGAFTKSLRTRKPKVVWGHDWNHPIGKVLEMYEVGPDDPRLPDKMKQAGIGGLYAKTQFNLKSEKGKEAFSNIVFFGEEAEWSIGYKTLDAEYDRKSGANNLKELALFEISPVLHGANHLTGTISIKSADQEWDGDDAEIEHGLYMLKEFVDGNPSFKVGPGNAGIIQDTIGGDILHGRGPRRGNLEDLLDYWRPIMKKPGGFRRCLVILADHPELGPLPNLCAWLHHETTGKWPNEGHHHGGHAVGSAASKLKSANPAHGPIAALAKATAEQFGEAVLIETATTEDVVFELNETLFKASYIVNEGDYFFSKKAPYVKPCGDECHCDGACEPEEDETIKLKEGRVLSTRNIAKLQEAFDILSTVLSVNVLKGEKIVISGGEGDLKSAFDTVNNFHGAVGGIQTGDSLEVTVKSEKHSAALKKIASAFGAKLESVEL